MIKSHVIDHSGNRVTCGVEFLIIFGFMLDLYSSNKEKKQILLSNFICYVIVCLINCYRIFLFIIVYLLNYYYFIVYGFLIHVFYFFQNTYL